MISAWIIASAVSFCLLASVKILWESELDVACRFDRVLPKAQGPGVALVSMGGCRQWQTAEYGLSQNVQGGSGKRAA